MSAYVKSGYVKIGYIEGDVDFASIQKKKINFVVDNKELSDSVITEIMSQKFDGYEDEVTVILGGSLKVAEKIDGAFSIKEVAGRMKDEDIEEIVNLIPTSDDNAEALLQMSSFIDSVASAIAANSSFARSVANLVLQDISVKIVAMNGDEIASSLVFDSETNSYKLDYDTSLLDGTDYEIRLSVI